jgi:accessory gene regulator B
VIEKLSARTARAIKQTVPHHPTSEAVLKYALEGIYNATFIVSFTLLISIITGKTAEVAIILVSFALLRQLSGGKHLKSGLTCVVFTTVLFTLLSFVSLALQTAQMMNIASVLLVAMFAPSQIEKQSRIPKKYYPVLKLAAAAMICTNFLYYLQYWRSASLYSHSH